MPPICCNEATPHNFKSRPHPFNVVLQGVPHYRYGKPDDREEILKGLSLYLDDPIVVALGNNGNLLGFFAILFTTDNGSVHEQGPIVRFVGIDGRISFSVGPSRWGVDGGEIRDFPSGTMSILWRGRYHKLVEAQVWGEPILTEMDVNWPTMYPALVNEHGQLPSLLPRQIYNGDTAGGKLVERLTASTSGN